MSPRVIIVGDPPRVSERTRGEARDGWRLFRSLRDGFEVAIPVYQILRIEDIGRRDHDEWHAVAVGEVFRDDHGSHTVIRDFIPNEWADRGRAHVRVAATAEGQVRELAHELHPTLKPVGIIHTHPRFTTNPSGTDRKEFWRDPNSVSIIVDPFDRPTVAVYRGPDGERLEEVASAALRDVPAASETSAGTQPPPRPKRASKSLRRGIVSAIAMTVVCVSPTLFFGLECVEIRRTTAALHDRMDELHSKMMELTARSSRAPIEDGHALECSAASGP